MHASSDVAIDTKSLEDELASFTAWEHLDLSDEDADDAFDGSTASSTLTAC